MTCTILDIEPNAELWTMMAPLSIKHFGWSWRELKLKKTRDCTIHPVFSTTLYSDRQIDEMIKFLTDPKEFSVFGIDPTFNIFNEDLSLTVTSFRNLQLVNKKTGKPPVFIGPVFMHQKKDW